MQDIHKRTLERMIECGKSMEDAHRVIDGHRCTIREVGNIEERRLKAERTYNAAMNDIRFDLAWVQSLCIHQWKLRVDAGGGYSDSICEICGKVE